MQTARFLHFTSSATDLFPSGIGYLDSKRLYFSYFQQLPCIKSLADIDYKKAAHWLEKEHETTIIKKHYLESFTSKKSEMERTHFIVVLHNKSHKHELQ